MPAASERPVSALRLSTLFAATMLYVGVSLPFFPVFLAGQGLTDGEIAMILTIPLVTRLAGNPLVTALSDRRTGPAWTLAACALAAMALSACLAFAKGFWPLAIVVCLLALTQGPMMPLADTLTLGELRRRAQTHGKPLDYGRIRVWGSASVFFTMLAAGWIVGLLPTQGVAWLMAAAALAPVWPALSLARRSAGNRHEERQQASASPTRFGPLALLVVSAGTVQASHAMYYSFSSLHWRAQGLSDGFIGTAWALGVGAEILFFVVAGRWLGGESQAKPFLVAGALGCIVRWIAMAAEPSPAALMALQTMHALTFASTHLGSVYLCASLAGPGQRAQAQGWLAASVSLGLALATLATGQIYAGSPASAYLLMAGMAGAGLTGIMIVFRMLGAKQ